MNRETIIKLAIESGWTIGPSTLNGLERFANLVSQQNDKWVGLTDDEIYKIAFSLQGEHWKKIANAIEAKLKEKNNG